MTPVERFRAVIDRIRHRLDPDELLEMEKAYKELVVAEVTKGLDEPERA